MSTGIGLLGNNMFAYCNNNPIALSDPHGYAAGWTNHVAICDGGSGYPISPYVANTPDEQIVGMVNGQGNLPYSNVRIGLGSYGKSGCAFIAIYNAMQLIGKPQSLASVTSEVCERHGTVCFGAGGVPPWSVRRYFSAHEIETSGSYSLQSLTQGVTEGSVIVFTVLNNKNNIFEGWHAMTALYTGGNYLVFNQYNDSSTYRSYTSLGDSFSNGAWIYGIRID